MDDEERITEISREALRQAELQLQAQVQLALSADQRALGLLSVLAPVGTAAIGYAVLVFRSADADLPVAIAALTTGAVLLAAAAACAYTARPVRFWLPGNRTFNWWGDGVESKSIAECLQTEGRNYDDYITDNKVIMEASAWWFRWALRLAITAPFFGLLALALAIGAA